MDGIPSHLLQDFGDLLAILNNANPNLIGDILKKSDSQNRSTANAITTDRNQQDRNTTDRNYQDRNSSHMGSERNSPKMGSDCNPLRPGLDRNTQRLCSDHNTSRLESETGKAEAQAIGVDGDRNTGNKSLIVSGYIGTDSPPINHNLAIAHSRDKITVISNPVQVQQQSRILEGANVEEGQLTPSETNLFDFPPLPNKAPCPVAAGSIFHAQEPSHKTFASLLADNREPPPPLSTKELKPVLKGDYFSVSVGDELKSRCIDDFKSSVIGRVVYSQGDKPHSNLQLKEILGDMWNVIGPWDLMVLGKGYFSIRLPTLEDRDRILAKRTWVIKPGIIRLQRWIPDFNPYKVNSSIAQVWIRIFELPVEYFRTEIVAALASAIGPVIKIDDRTRDRTLCHYARVLVELDLKNDTQEQIMLERGGYCSFVSIQYEWLPSFCRDCNVIGHDRANCRNGPSNPPTGKTKNIPDKPKTQNRGKEKEWVPKDSTQIPNSKTDFTHNSFATLDELEDGFKQDIEELNKAEFEGLNAAGTSGVDKTKTPLNDSLEEEDNLENEQQQAYIETQNTTPCRVDNPPLQTTEEQGLIKPNNDSNASLDSSEHSDNNEDDEEQYPNDPLREESDNSHSANTDSSFKAGTRVYSKQVFQQTQEYNLRNKRHNTSQDIDEAMSIVKEATTAPFQVIHTTTDRSMTEMRQASSWTKENERKVPPKHGSKINTTKRGSSKNAR